VVDLPDTGYAAISNGRQKLAWCLLLKKSSWTHQFLGETCEAGKKYSRIIALAGM
jgi:hypothetical protein